MANKIRKHKNQSPADLYRYAQRAIEKHDFKEALKNAKVCYRQDPSHEHREILERSWLARGLQLARAGLQAEGRAAAQELMAMGPLHPEVQRELPELLLAVGLYDQAVASGKLSSASQGADPLLLARAADRAITDPATAPASLVGIREGAERVRLALDALHDGNEAASLLILADVPRNSPFAEWRLFVRGLAAYYRHDDEAMRANWDRLDKNRFAVRLAGPLRYLANPSANAVEPAGYREAIRTLETDVLGGPVLWYFESLQRTLAEDRWREAVQGVRSRKKELQAKMPDLARRLERLLYDMTVRNANARWLRDLSVGIDPPAWDPHWNRARAMISEVAAEDEFETTEGYWLAYLEDLAVVPDCCTKSQQYFKPAERTLAQAMIWNRLGRGWADEADEELCDCESCRRERLENKLGSNETVTQQSRAIECFKKASDLAPTYAEAYRDLAACYIVWNQVDAAAETHRHLLQHVPDDFDAIAFLFRHHLERGESAAVSDYALRARRLKPASEEVLDMVVTGHFLAARTFALQERCDAARAELTAVAAMGANPTAKSYDLSVRQAMVEFKAGQLEAGQRFVDQAIVEGEQGAPKVGNGADVYLALAIEAVRYDVPFQLDDLPRQFLSRWHTSLKKRNSHAAGGMSRRMLAFMPETGRPAGKLAFLNNILERVVAYVGGCTRIQWQPDDLLEVCRLLVRLLDEAEFRKVRKPLEKLLDVGRKKFPAEPEFHFTRGELEMRRGPSGCNRRLARECFEMANQCASASVRPNAKEIQQRATAALDLLGPGSLEQPHQRSSRGAPDTAGMPADFLPGGFSVGDMKRMIERAAESMGLDPNDVVDDILGELNAGKWKKSK